MKRRFSLMACAIVVCALCSCGDDSVQESYDYAQLERLAMYEAYYTASEMLIAELIEQIERMDANSYYDTVGSGTAAIMYTKAKNDLNK